MHRRVIDDMKKESKALKRWMIVLYIAGISFIVSMWLQFDKELLYAYIIISVAVIIYLIYILYWWFCVKKYRIEIDDEKVYIETLFERMEIQMKDIEKYSYKRYRRSPLFKFYLFVQGKRYLIYTRFKWELEIILNDNNVEQV